MEEIKKKVCNKCSEEKTEDDFYNYKRKGVYKKHGVCKVCQFENSKKYKPYYTNDYTIENLDGEVWKEIPSLQGYYEASNMGRIKSKERLITTPKGKSYIKPQQLLSPNNNGNGYFTVMLTVDGKSFRKYIHRLVVEAFTGNDVCESVDHINGDKSNNNIENLKCCTARENNIEYQKRNKTKSCRSVGVSFYSGIGKYGASIKIEKNNYTLGTYSTEKEASEAYQKALYDWETLKQKPREVKKLGKREKGEYTGIFYQNKSYRYAFYFNYRTYSVNTFIKKEEALKCKNLLIDLLPLEYDEELLLLFISEFNDKYYRNQKQIVKNLKFLK